MSMSHDEMIAVIQAHKDGRVIQCRDMRDIDDTWNEGEYFVWNFESFEYRIKPEPHSLWLVRYQSGNSASCFYTEHAAMISAASINKATIHEYKEVLP